MTARGKVFELLDFPKFAVPSVLAMHAAPTAFRLRERLGGGGFMSYGQIWPRCDHIVRGFATEAYILSVFNAYRDSWKNESVRDVVRLLGRVLGGKGNWYPEANVAKYVLGVWFKPSIKGI